MGWTSKIIAADLVGSYMNAQNVAADSFTVSYAGTAGSVAVVYKS